MHSLRRIGAAGMLAIVLVLAACIPGNNGGGWGVGSSQGDTSVNSVHDHGGIVVSIFPDVGPVMQALVPVWTRTHPNIPIAFVAAPTVTNAVNQNTYIGVDVIVNDSHTVQTDLRGQGLIDGLGYRFTATTLDFVVPASNPGHITRLQDTAGTNLKLINIDWTTGVSEFTLAALEAMMRDPAFQGANIPCGTNYASCTYGNMAVTVPDGLAAGRLLVNPALSGVPLQGIALPLQGAFIYHTDYLQVNRELGAGSLTALPVPTNFAPPHAFWVAVGAYEAVNKPGASTFQSFLLSAPAQAVLRSYGYLPPP